VVKTHIDEAAFQSQDVVIGSKVEKKFRLVIRFPEWRRVLEVVKLPERPLRIAEPQIHFLAENGVKKYKRASGEASQASPNARQVNPALGLHPLFSPYLGDDSKSKEVFPEKGDPMKGEKLKDMLGTRIRRNDLEERWRRCKS
jgi:hypothetical protein